jgi:hypothetical protein
VALELGELIHACLDVMIKIRSSMLVLFPSLSMSRWSTSPIQQPCRSDQHRGSQEGLINALLCTDNSST